MKKEEEIRQFYEKYHTVKIANPIGNFMQRERCNQLRFLIKNIQGKVLIIGCGSQDDMSIINKECKGVGIDISAEAIKKSKKGYPRFEYFVADATNLPLPDNSFDCVVCSEVIEHIPENERVLSEVKRILKNNGVFIITTPNWLSWYGLARKIAEKLFKRPFTAGNQPIDNWLTPFSLRKKLKKYGFKIILFRGLWYYPPTGKGNKQISSRIVIPIVKLFYPFEILSRSIFPWFGHMIIFKTKIIKNEMGKFNKQQLKSLYNTDYVSKYPSSNKKKLRRLFKFINLDRNDIVLDVGCGNGLLLDYISNKIRFYYGVDFLENFINVAKSRQKKNKIINAKFVCEDINIFCKDFKGNFNKIFALDFVEHIYDEDFKRIFTSLYNSLKIGGELYIHTPNGEYFLEVFKKKGMLKQFPQHIAVRTAIDYKKLLTKSGFNNIRIIYLFHYIQILSILDLLRYLPHIGKYFQARLFIICKK